MCGRYTLSADPEVLRSHFDLGEVPALPPRFNIAPSQEAPLIRQGPEHRELALARWGLVPFWAKGPKTRYRMINARAETVATKPAFRHAFRRRRCLVPADGFYEWQARPGGKQPYYFRLIGQAVFAFAGLWERWEGEEETLESFTIIVTDANALVRPIHDRMPVILDPADYMRWLDPGYRDSAALRQLLLPYPPERMTGYPVSTRVNAPGEEGPELIQPIRADRSRQ